jgi:hypothetical protein
MTTKKLLNKNCALTQERKFAAKENNNNNNNNTNSNMI